MKNIYVNACNCHQGGGKTLLDAFIEGISNQDYNFYIFIDKRYSPPKNYNKNISFINIKLFERFFISYRIKKRIKNHDKIIYFGNLPPILDFKNNEVILLLSNRFYVDKISFKGFLLKDIIKIKLEKIYFNFTLKNIDEFIVQTNTMKILLSQRIPNKIINVLPFENSLVPINLKVFNKETLTFIYVASLTPYKNHKKLLEAWLNLKIKGYNPTLYLTMDQNNDIYKWIKLFVNKYKLNVIFLENINRNDLLNLYKSCEYLVYPSTFEAYGLPLIEALNYNLKVLCADLDYCWDLIKPFDFFNPYDASSIERCILRRYDYNLNSTKILTPKEFLNKIIK